MKTKQIKRFWGFIQKEVLHILRDKRSLVILFGMPIIQIMLFGFAITNEINQAKIAILDLSKDVVTTKITNKILSTGYFQLSEYLHDYKDIESAFKRGQIKEVIIFDQDFANNLENNGTANCKIIADGTDPNTGNTVIFYTSAIIKNFMFEYNKASANSFNINTEVRMRYNEELKGVFLFIPGLITVILMLLSAMMTSISLTKEKELGSMEILLTSPVNPLLIIISKVIPYLILSLLNANIILLLGKFVFHVPIQGNIFFLEFELLLFILTALSLGIFISTKTESQQIALMVSLMGLMLPTILLSGFIFPIENMPLPLQIISNFLPAKWFIIIVKEIMLKGAGLQDIFKETVILCGFILFFILLSVKNFKVRLEK